MKVRLKDLGTIFTGNTPSKRVDEYWDNSDIKFIKPDIIKDELCVISSANEYISAGAKNASRIVPANSVLVTCIGNIGRVGITEEEVAFNQQINAIVPNRTIIPKYLAYAIYANRKQLQAIANAPVVPIINKTQFSDFEISICESLEKQNKIVRILDTISEIITHNKKKIEALDDLIKARFVEMFGLPGTDPFGYGKVKLGECCEINPKKTKNARLADGVEVSFVPMSSVSEKGEIDPSDIRKYEVVKKGFTYFTENDVLFAKITPCMENGKGAIAKGLMNGIGFGSTEFHVLRSTHGLSNPYWIYTITSFKTFRKDAESNMTGSAGQRRTPASFLEGYEISLPPIELQNQFATFVAQIDKSKFAVQKSLEKTQLLFDSLMQEYFG